jgi:hypothetical protein
MITQEDLIEMNRLDNLTNLNSDSDIDSIYNLLKKYVNNTLMPPIKGCNCSSGIKNYYLMLMNFYKTSKNG